MFLPAVDTEKCIGCGICTRVCPGLSEEYDGKASLTETILGDVNAAYNTWSRDPVLRHVSGSGGTVSSIVSALLAEGKYDAAFCVDSYSYNGQLLTKEIHSSDVPSDWGESTLPKSRYLPVSHENAVAYIKNHPDKHIILIGTSCAVRAMRKAIRFCHANPDQFLFIGLFCDTVFNYNVIDYYQREFFPDKLLSGLHFKNKESGGWPGNMKVFFADGTTAYLDKKERAGVKSYFMPERCLYCSDKLNICADISVGDNYTDQDSSPLGSNSVLIRTQRGEQAWSDACWCMEYEPFDKEKLIAAQYLEGRNSHFYYAALKRERVEKKTGRKVLNNGTVTLAERPVEYERAWHHDLRKLNAGAKYKDDPAKLKRMIADEADDSALKSVGRFGERVYYALKRRLRSK